MRIVCVGGGPAGLYFSILMKKLDPRADITVVERNAPYQTFGWGVVFSDETLGYLEENDPETHREITATFAHWDAIDIHYRGEVVRSGGHGFSGISRKRLLNILQGRAERLGVRLVFNAEVDDLAGFAGADLIVAADGVKSKVRGAHADVFAPELEVGRCKYIWLGTDLVLDAFTFVFEPSEHGWFQVHAYRFDDARSTFIVECHERTWARAGLDRADAAESIAFLERLFAGTLKGHRLLENKSAWINFPTVRCRTWRHGNVVLMGDAAHTAHFSIGSGTKLAMEDAIALARAFAAVADVKRALEVYEEERLPIVQRTQHAAESSLRWFENAERYMEMAPLELATSLLTRSKKVTFDNLRLRDPAFAERVASWFVAHRSAAPALEGSAPAVYRPPSPPPPPMLTPFTLRGMTLANRVVVSPMCQYSCDDGTPTDWHLVHLGSRALGGAGLVFAEMTNVSRDARISPACAGMYRPEHLAAWRRVVDFVHGESGARIAMQLGHAGRKGSTSVPWEGMDEPLPAGNWPLLAPSPIPYAPRNQVPREMDRADMERVRDDFVAAARMAAEAGFDLLELHMAHGYLLATFLSPLTNRRQDRYGGSLENRMRYPLEVFEAVRAVWPEARPMSVRISATDWVEGGFDPAQAVLVARAFRERGLDILNVSAGQTTPEQKPVYGRMYQTLFSDQIRHEAGIPTIAVGNITTAEQVNTIVAAGRADLVALARRHLDDPYFTLHAARELDWAGAAWPKPYLAATTLGGRGRRDT